MSMGSDWRPVALGDGSDALSAFERAGSAERPPVVLLHGAGGNALTWTGIAPAFGDRRMLLVDMPAHGRSPVATSWNLDDIAKRIGEAVAPWLGEARAIWGGHSWGGKVAGLVAAAEPSRCSGLALFDPSPSAAVPVPIDEFVDGTWGVEMAPYASADAAADAARELRHWQPWDEHAAAAFRHGLAQRENGTWSLRPTRRELLELATATLHSDRSDELAVAATVPALLVVAEESSAWQGITNRLVYASAAQVVIPGHHWIHQCSRVPVANAVADWLARDDFR